MWTNPPKKLSYYFLAIFGEYISKSGQLTVLTNGQTQDNWQYWPMGKLRKTDSTDP